MNVKITRITSITPFIGLDGITANITQKSGITSIIRILEEEFKRARMELVDDQVRGLVSTYRMKVKLTAAAMVIESVSMSFAGVAAEYATGIGRNREEGEGVVAVGGVGDHMREFRAT
ncbi:hypothetical protein ACH5RR_025230 [Cinchona calisaya]|uniref:Uncharacterized protein n=1 Tax=Cinchona calisaya TaxID=153742 RepID=A0ABD2Z052_9GENT